MPVEARLEGDHVAGDERLALDPADARALVHLEPDAVAERVEEAVDEHLALVLVQLRRVAVLVEEVADRRWMSLPLTPGVTAATARSSASFASRWHSASSSDGSPSENVRVMSEKQADSRSRGKRSKTTTSSEAIAPGAAVVADRRLRAVRDDELVAAAAVVGERALDLELEPLAGERLAAEREHAVRALGRPQQLDADRDAGLDGAAGTADPLELVLGS